MTVHRQNSHNGLRYAGSMIAKGKASHMRFLDIQSDDIHVLALRLSLLPGIFMPLMRSVTFYRTTRRFYQAEANRGLPF